MGAILEEKASATVVHYTARIIFAFTSSVVSVSTGFKTRFSGVKGLTIVFVCSWPVC